MASANAGGWRYTAGYGWNWRSARAIGRALGSLALPMPAWFRPLVARCLLSGTALRADAEGVWGSAASAATGAAGPCPWKDVTVVVVWNYDHLRIIGLGRRGEVIGGGPAAKPLESGGGGQSRPARRRAFRRHPSYPAFIAPDGSPYGAANVVTANGWCVDIARLRETVRHFAPQARFLDLSGISVAPESGGPFGYVLEAVAGLAELIGWRRFGWLLGVGAAAAALAVAAANVGTQSLAPIGVAVGAVALVLLGWRSVAVRRRRRRSAHPESWLASAREDAEGSPLGALRRSRLAAWALRAGLTGRRRNRGYPLR